MRSPLLLSKLKDVLTPEEIKLELNQLIQQARPVYPNLANRLDEMKRWIVGKKNGLLMRKRYVMQLLAELVAHTTFWLEVESLPSEDRNIIFAQLSPAEQYWYQHLFPTWFNEPDPKLEVWKPKLMADEFTKSDAQLIRNACQLIERGGGGTFTPYIADLSMATDLIAFGVKKLVLCTQLTTVRDSHSSVKYSKWMLNLKYWRIQRGLFLSYNPGLPQPYIKVGKCVLESSDSLPQRCYCRKNMDL